MLNFGAKKSALQRLEEAVQEHSKERDKVQNAAIGLHNLRTSVVESNVAAIESYFSRLANKPKEFVKHPKVGPVEMSVVVPEPSSSVLLLECKGVGCVELKGSMGS